MKPKINKIIDNINNKKDICIVLPTFNQYNETKKCIKLLKKQTLVPDIIIVDNNSSDGTFEKLQKDFNDIILIDTGGNYGGAGGFYIGQKYAYEQGYKWIILNDNDAYPIDDNLIEKIIKSKKDNFFNSFINLAEETNSSLKVFHYGVFTRGEIKKYGFVDYKIFIYGDDVEYFNRFKNPKLIKVNVKYFHPLKNFYPAKMLYFLVRNQNYNDSLYFSFKTHFFNNIKALLASLIYKYLWGLDKYYYFFREGLKDSIKNNFSRNQEIISSKINNNISFQINKIDCFFDSYKNKKKVLFSLKKVFNGYIIDDKINIKNIPIPRKEILGKKIFITTGFNSFDRIILTIYFSKVIFIKNIDFESNKVEYFEFNNNLYKKILVLLIFIFQVPIIFFKTLRIRKVFKKINLDYLFPF